MIGRLRTLAWRMALLAVVAAAHGGAVAEPKTIAVWTRAAFNVQEAAAIKGAAAAFNQSQKAYKVELLWASFHDYADWVQSVAVTGTLPCLLEMDGPLLAQLAWPGYLQSLDRFVSAELRRDLLPSIVEQGTYQGRLYSLGQYDSGLGLWSNRRYLAAARLRVPTVARPWTLAEFEQAMQALSRLQGVEYPLSLGVYAGVGEFYPYAYLPILAGFGGDFIDRTGNGRAGGVMDGPQSVAAMRRFQQWFQKGWTRAVFDRNDDFERGRTALLWIGHWKYTDMREALGDDLLLLPLPDFGHGLKTGMGSWAWSITSACPDPDGAWAFLSHLMTAEEILRVTNANGAVPARRSALGRSALYGPGRPLQVFAQQLFSGSGVPRPATPGYGIVSKAYANAVQAIITGADVQTELTRAAQIIDRDIAANRGYSH